MIDDDNRNDNDTDETSCGKGTTANGLLGWLNSCTISMHSKAHWFIGVGKATLVKLYSHSYQIYSK